MSITTEQIAKEYQDAQEKLNRIEETLSRIRDLPIQIAPYTEQSIRELINAKKDTLKIINQRWFQDCIK